MYMSWHYINPIPILAQRSYPADTNLEFLSHLLFSFKKRLLILQKRNKIKLTRASLTDFQKSSKKGYPQTKYKQEKEKNCT